MVSCEFFLGLVLNLTFVFLSKETILTDYEYLLTQMIL
jgi:hypothetical protein